MPALDNPTPVQGHGDLTVEAEGGVPKPGAPHRGGTRDLEWGIAIESQEKGS